MAEQEKTRGCIEPIRERRFDGGYERSDEAHQQPLGFYSGSHSDFYKTSVKFSLLHRLT